MVMAFPLIPGLTALIQEVHDRLVEPLWRFEVDEMTRALEHLDGSLGHLGGKLARELDIVAHFAAQGFGRHVAAWRDVVVLAHEEEHGLSEKRYFGRHRLAPDH